MDDFEVGPVRSASNPDLVSVDLAVDTLWNRIFTMGGLMFIGLLVLVAGPFAVVKGRKTRTNVQRLSGQVLTPVAVDLVSQNSVYGTTTVVYKADTGSGVKKYGVSLSKKQKPFMLRAKDKALGLFAPGQEYVFLLDEALTRVDINDDERRARRKARGTA